MALTHLVDTSVLTRLASDAVRASVEPLTKAGRIARADLCDLEIGYSARNVRKWEGLIDAPQVFAKVTGQRCAWVVPAGSVE